MTESYSILIIDDDEVDRMTLTRALKSAEIPAQISEAITGEQGIAVTKTSELDCIYLDYMLPDDNGLSVLKSLRETGVDSPIVMLTGQNDAHLAVEMMKAGASDYLSKDGLSAEILSRSFHNVIRVHRAEVERKQAQKQQQILLEKLQNTQDQLLQSEKLASIGQLAAGVAHEINNPVGYINSNLSTLCQYMDDLYPLLEAYEQAESYLSNNNIVTAIQSIKQQIDLQYLKEDILSLVEESKEGVIRVKQIVQDLKDFSHVDEAEWQWVDLHKGLDSTLNIAHNEIKYKADVIKEYGDIPSIECFPSQLNQVFMNLFVNAAQSIVERGTIIIRTGVENEGIWLEVIDNGCGIAEDKLNRIFDPFFTTKPVGKGTGLGLSLSYSIIQKHSGTIKAISKNGQGTTFRIWLPIKQNQTQAVG